MGIGLAHRVLGSGRFFLGWLPSLSLDESLTLWALTLSLDHLYLRVCKLLRHFALLWWRWFTSSGKLCHSCM
jgi:hypothetical protein